MNTTIALVLTALFFLTGCKTTPDSSDPKGSGSQALTFTTTGTGAGTTTGTGTGDGTATGTAAGTASGSGTGSGSAGTGTGETVAGSPLLVASPAVIRFGSLPIGQSTSATVRITNLGTAPTGLLTYIGPDGDFSMGPGSNCPSTMGVGATCTIEIVFRPTAAGHRATPLAVNYATDLQLGMYFEGYGTVVSPPPPPPTPAPICESGAYGGSGMILESPVTGYASEAHRVALQSDCKAVVVGQTYGCPGHSASVYCPVVVRYKSNGRLDTDFGTAGKRLLPVGVTNRHASARAVAIQSDGKIIVGIRGSSSVTKRPALIVMRLNANGTPDASFGTDGMARVPHFHATYGDTLTALALQSDGKIVVVGEVFGPNGWRNFGIARLNSNGTMDTTFGDLGAGRPRDGRTRVVVTKDPDFDTDVAIKSDGRIVVSGRARRTGQQGNSYDLTLVQLNPDGSVDSSFGLGGIAGADVARREDGANAVEILPSGDLLAAGFSYRRVSSRWDFALALFTPGGLIDTDFGTAGTGIVTTTLSNRDDRIMDVALDDDRFVVAAGYKTLSATRRDIAVARYDLDGALDSSFGTNGIVTIAVSNKHDEARSVVVQPDRKVLFVGTCYDTIIRHHKMCTIRLKTNGSLDAPLP